MTNSIHIDFETYSPQDLTSVGAFRYAEDPEARILLCAVAINDGPVLVWSITDQYGYESEQAVDAIQKAAERGYTFYAHNAQFELAIARNCWEQMDILYDPTKLNWQCTAAAARRAGIPVSLEKCAEVLGLPQQKDSNGKRLIRKFCIGIPMPDPTDFHDDWVQFAEYCRQDVVVEREIHKRLDHFLVESDQSGVSQVAWEVDKTINMTGIPVNVGSLSKAQKILSESEKVLRQQFTAITGLKPTQTAALTTWLKARGWPHNGISASEMGKGYPTGSKELQEAISLRQALSFSATKKIKPMLDCACADGRVRGTLQYYGALTGRWSGRLIQPQNFKRPTIRFTDAVMQYLEESANPTAQEVELLFGSPLEVISSCIRHFIAHPDYGLLDADYAAIEARLICWLAGEQKALDEYGRGVDRYKRMGCVIFGKRESEITSDERFIGKGVILGAGFGMGSKKFYENTKAMAEAFGITGVRVTPALAEKAIAAWRETHPNVVRYWYECENAAKLALRQPKQWIPVRNVAFASQMIAGMRYLMVRLPSGRRLYYPKVGLKADGSLEFYGRIPGKANFGMVGTYSGRIVENITQAVAADIMANGASKCIEAGYEVIALVHDQALALAKPNKPLDKYVHLLKTLPAWAAGLPLDAEGQQTKYYRK